MRRGKLGSRLIGDNCAGGAQPAREHGSGPEARSTREVSCEVRFSLQGSSEVACPAVEFSSITFSIGDLARRLARWRANSILERVLKRLSLFFVHSAHTRRRTYKRIGMPNQGHNHTSAITHNRERTHAIAFARTQRHGARPCAPSQ